MTVSRYILGMRVDALNYGRAVGQCVEWAARGESRYVAVATVNNVMESYDDDSFRLIMNSADMVTSDGMPLVWGLQMLGARQAERVYGPYLMPFVLDAAERDGIPVGFYGASDEVIGRLQGVVSQRWPKLQLSYLYSPPFRPLTPEEDARIVADMNLSGARIVFVGLSTPKQERWMVAHRGKVHAVMLGVGAAFDFLSGVKPQAPQWMMRMGLEWFFRLLSEPRRLWKRYLTQNPRFVVLFAMQKMGLYRKGTVHCPNES